MADTQLKEVRDSIQFKTMNLFFRGALLGAIKKGTMELGINGVYADLDQVDGFEGLFKSWNKGTTLALKATVLTTDLQFLIKQFLDGQVDTNIRGAHIGTGKIRDLVEVAGEVRLHEKGVAETNKTQDVLIYNAVIEVNITLLFGGELPPEYEIVFKIMPDVCRTEGKNIGFLGDWSYIESAPQAVVIGCDREMRHPVFSETTAKVIPCMSIRRKAFNIYWELSGVTGDINDAGGYSPGDQNIIFDNLSTASGITVGSYILFGAGPTLHLIYVTSITYNAGNTSGTITGAVWNDINNNAQALVDDETFQVINTVDIERGRDKDEWASDDDLVATAGNNFVDATYANVKGVITYVGNGTANITASADGVSSPDLVVTAAAS